MLKKFCVALILLFVFSISINLLGIESTEIYFPGTLDSFWVYEDQDGNELTRHSIEGEEIAGITYSAFSYEPELEDWINYSPFIHPFLYHIFDSDVAVTLFVGDEVEKSVKARFKNEIETFVEIIKEQAPPELDVSVFDMGVDVEVEAEDHLFLLPDTIIVDLEWGAHQIEANVTLIPQGVGVSEDEQLLIDFTIVETGIARGTETVETIAGTFKDCLKVEYRTETTAVFTPNQSPDEVAAPGETVTTVWFAPNIGIVKLHQKSGHMFLDLIPDDADFPVAFPPNQEKTLELKRYEIKTAESESNTEN